LDDVARTALSAVSAERLTGFNVGLGFVGVLLTSWLVVSHVLLEPICPTLIGIPACYVLVPAYLAATVGAWRADTSAGSSVFIIGAGAVALIGVWFSLNQVFGGAACPELEGLPMCYVSMLAGATMLTVDQLRRRTVQISPPR
jgi:hypothetical protein